MSQLPKSPPTVTTYSVWFDSIRSGIIRLASERNLLIEKYPHEAPVWCLMFRHPLGGVGQINIEMRDGNLVSVAGAWWKDDFDAGTRSSNDFGQEIVARNDAAVEQCASKMLTKILTHPHVWAEVTDGCKSAWHAMGRAWFEDIEKRYPVLKEKTE